VCECAEDEDEEEEEEDSVSDDVEREKMTWSEKKKLDSSRVSSTSGNCCRFPFPLRRRRHSLMREGSRRRRGTFFFLLFVYLLAHPPPEARLNYYYASSLPLLASLAHSHALTRSLALAETPSGPEERVPRRKIAPLSRFPEDLLPRAPGRNEIDRF